MKEKATVSSYKIFSIVNSIVLGSVAILCVIPMIHVLAVSLSAPALVEAGKVGLFPLAPTLKSYAIVLEDKAFWNSISMSFKRIIIGGGLSLFLTVLTAYPLSIDTKLFKTRKYYVWYIMFTMLFSGGMVPIFLIVFYTGLMDSIWALVIPSAINAWNIILMLNFFRQLPKELSEAAFVNGAGHWTILFTIFIPISKPAIATIGLFILVFHWNSWFDGMLYMQRPENYPLQTYLQSMLSIDLSQFVSQSDLKVMNQISQKTIQSAQIFIGAIPIFCVYPLLQKHFTKGLVLGSVKG